MSEHNITVQGGSSVRLKTAGKYCDRDILVHTEAVEEKDVNFYDYDGTLLYSYTVAEAQALTELPPAPTPPKDFLVFEEWNWTLDQIKDYNDPVQVGAIYKPVDDKTRVVIQIDEDWQKEVVIRYKQWGGSLTVDWGDGNVEEPTTVSSGTAFTVNHTYAESGSYIITIEANSTWDFGHSTQTTPFFGNQTTKNGAVALREVYCGAKARTVVYAFYNARRLNTITLSKSQNRIWAYAFYVCQTLKAILFPSTMTTIDTTAFYHSKMLGVCSLSPNIETITPPETFTECRIRRFTIPKKIKTIGVRGGYCERMVLKSGLTEIANYCFYENEVMTELTLPETVTSIGANAFYNTFSMLRLRFLPTTPPTVANANAFTGMPATCIVEVPAASLDAYKNATNYGTIAAQMVGV